MLEVDKSAMRDVWSFKVKVECLDSNEEPQLLGMLSQPTRKGEVSVEDPNRRIFSFELLDLEYGSWEEPGKHDVIVAFYATGPYGYLELFRSRWPVYWFDSEDPTPDQAVLDQIDNWSHVEGFDSPNLSEFLELGDDAPEEL